MNLKSCCELYLSHNLISSVPESLTALTTLTILTLSHNKLTRLPEGLSNLRQLTHFSTSHNPLTEEPQKDTTDMLWFTVPKSLRSSESTNAFAYNDGLDPYLYPNF
eukprot:TRINITY_DN3607_c0_g1_i2.p1 TRINITY_DN3607_c0_g1~~TRINITY_DN3607_c0_g1_i2.p1  ORF type:complete len:106 (+),score=8.77 TRINITY_DN3607_c0_g1_i2:775-1092(+)